MELILYIAFGILGGFVLILSLLGIIGALVKHSQRSPAPSVLSAPLRTPPAAELAEFELLYPERASAIRGKAWARIHYLMLTECSVTGPIRNELREEAIAQVNSADLRDAVRSLLSAPSYEQTHELEVKGTVFAQRLFGRLRGGLLPSRPSLIDSIYLSKVNSKMKSTPYQSSFMHIKKPRRLIGSTGH